MTPKEKRLLIVALLMFGVYFLPFVIYPVTSDWVTQKYDSIQQRKSQVQRLRRLISQVNSWKEEHAKILARKQAVEAALLQGHSYNLIATQLQDTLTQTAIKTKLRIRSLEIAEFSELKHWLLVSQTLQFKATSQQLYDFIMAIQTYKIRLKVVILNVQVGRKDTLEGNLTVTGTSHLIANTDKNDAL